VDIIETRSESGTERFLLKYLEEFEIRFRVFDRNDISIKSFDSPENVIEIRLSSASRPNKGQYITEMAVDLSDILDGCGSKTERVNGPLEIVIPFRST
jgi:hypothetical protein